MRCPLIAVGFVALLAGCTHAWGTAEVVSGSPIAKPHAGGAGMQRLVALRAELEAELSELEADLAAGRADDAARERRVLLVVALREIDDAVARSRSSASADLSAPWLQAANRREALLADARESVMAAREQDRDRDAIDDEAPDRPGYVGGVPAPAAAPPPADESEEDKTPKAEARRRKKLKLFGITDQDDEGDGRGEASGGPRPPGHAGGEKKEDGKGGIEKAVVANDADAIDRRPELEKHAARFRACVPRTTPGAGTAAPLQIIIRAHLASDGSFRNARVEGGEALAPQVISCLADTMQAIHVTPPTGGSVVVSFPLNLR